MATIIQRSFASGELTPDLYARTDVAKYQNGLRTALNVVILKTGGAINRPGTEWVCEVRDSSNADRVLIPAKQATTAGTTGWVGVEMEVANSTYHRGFELGAPVLETAVNITDITQADPAVVTAASHGYANGDEVYIQGVSGMTEVNDRFFIVANQTTNTFELNDRDWET